MPVLRRGLPPEEARAALLLVHGRGVSAQDFLRLADELDTEGLALLAPQAEGNSWYPHGFLAPLEENEPGVSSAIGLLADLIDSLGSAGIPPERIALLGFSQGACLALELAARRPRRYGGVFGLSGGLIGPPGMPREPRKPGGSLAGTPVFLGCGEPDPYIPAWRVRETAEVLSSLDGEVTLRLYPGIGHRIVRDELDFIEARLRRIKERS